MPNILSHYRPTLFSKRRLSQATLSRLLRYGVLALTVAFGTCIGLALRGTTEISAVWPANGIILALMLACGRTRHLEQATALAVGLGSSIVVAVAAGGSVSNSISFMLSNLAEILVAFALLRSRIGTRSSLSRPADLLFFAVLGVGVAPLASGFCVVFLFGLYRVELIPFWWASHAVGLALSAPLTLVVRRGWTRPFRGRQNEAASLLALILAVTGISFWQTSLPLLFLPFPPLVLAAMRFGAPGAALTLPLCALMALLCTAYGHGPIMLMAASGSLAGLVTLQLYIAALTVTVMPLGTAISQFRRREQILGLRAATVREVEARMRKSEILYRLLADHSSDIISRFDLDGGRLYVSPSVVEILGWSAEEMLASDYKKHIHPDDLAQFLVVGEQMRQGIERLSNVYRYLRRDGSWAWLDARLILVHEPDGSPREFISNTRDITRQKEAEIALEAAAAELTELAATDALTGVANRRRFDEMLDREWRRAMRSHEQLSLLLIDVDHFKQFNDHYGHLMGDTCLHAIATAIAGSIRRPGDLVARYGGEEFAVILPNTDGSGAMEIAARVHEGIAALAMPHVGNPGGCVTVSIGSADRMANRSTDSSVLIETADSGLYAAKRGGRNRSAQAPATGDEPDRVVRLQIRR